MRQTGHGRLSPRGCKGCASASCTQRIPASWRHVTAARRRVSSLRSSCHRSSESTRQLACAILLYTSAAVQYLPDEHEASCCAPPSHADKACRLQ